MAIGSTALANLLIILIIGIVAGLAFNRYARSWLARLGGTTRSDITSALVGIAGAFIGFHISVLLGLLPSPLMHYVSHRLVLSSCCGYGAVGKGHAATILSVRFVARCI